MSHWILPDREALLNAPAVLELIMGRMRRFLIALASSLIGCIQSIHAADADDWVQQNLVNGEKVLCQRDVSGEYFFLAYAEGKVKVGSRLDMTGYPYAHVFSVAWSFRNENDASVVAKVPPVAYKERYIKSDSKVFAENVEYQTLEIAKAKTLHVAVHIRKCAGAACDKQLAANKNETEYEVDLCVVPVSEFATR